jgi:hypothetical protein
MSRFSAAPGEGEPTVTLVEIDDYEAKVGMYALSVKAAIQLANELLTAAMKINEQRLKKLLHKINRLDDTSVALPALPTPEKPEGDN